MAALSCTLASDAFIHSSKTRPSMCWYSAGRFRNSRQQAVRRLVNSMLDSEDVLQQFLSTCSMRYGPLSVRSAFSLRISSIGIKDDSVLLDSTRRLSTVLSSYTLHSNKICNTWNVANKTLGERRLSSKRIWFGSGVHIQTPDPRLPKFNGTSLFRVTFVVKFSWIYDQFVQRYESNCGKMPQLAMLRNPSKNAYANGSLPKFNQFFLVHRYICGKSFVKIC